MTSRIAPLQLDARVCFEDRWQGRIAGCEVSESWEVLNVTVSSGILFFASSVKLPFTAVTKWSNEGVYFNVISFHAFNREVPPVAAPARPLDRGTPVSHPGARFAGVLVGDDRRATAVLVTSGTTTHRVPVADAAFEGKTLTLSQQIENFPEYRGDQDLLDDVRTVLREDNVIPQDAKQALDVDVNGGVVTLSGNVRVPQHARLVEAVLGRVSGIVEVQNEIVDDASLESTIGLSLDRAGIQRSSDIHARATLGEVILFGYAPSLAAVDEVIRIVGRIAGVRKVTSRIELRAAVA